MRFISISAICPPYRSLSNDFIRNEDIESSQPLMPRREEHGFTAATIKGCLRPYAKNMATLDQTGYVVCGLSVFSSVISIATLWLHSIEQNHESHKEILGTEILNLLLMVFIYVRRILWCSALSINASKKAAEWLHLPDHSAEQNTAENGANITQQPRNCFVPVAQWWRKLNDADQRYYLLKSGSFTFIALGLYLHITEKDHEHHEKMLICETYNVFFSIFFSLKDITRAIHKNRGQQSLLPQNFTEIPNYQTI